MCDRLMYEVCLCYGHQSVLPFLVRSGSSSLQRDQYVIIMMLLLVTDLNLLS